MTEQEILEQLRSIVDHASCSNPWIAAILMAVIIAITHSGCSTLLAHCTQWLMESGKAIS